MVFLAKDLIQVAPFSKNTFFRRINELKEQNRIKPPSVGIYYNESEAENIAKELGYHSEWLEFVQQKKTKG